VPPAVPPQPSKPEPLPEPELPPESPPLPTELPPEPPSELPQMPAAILPPPPPDKPAPPPDPKPQPRAEPVRRKPQPRAEPVRRKPQPRPAVQAHAPVSAAAPAAPAVGVPGPEASAAQAPWRALVAAHLQRHKRYPAGAQARREQGTVLLSFSMDRNGRVLSRAIARSSGVAELDAEVLAMIARAQPLPPFPPAMPQARMSLTVPIRFSLQ
jgi:protein TonB